ncbi:glycoside hydrolase family 3 C-terminal domain-containing protein [Tricladium varicosporioides]|nr:glycoside hydrolase family 3 C-terminal domain-containing protein [Hymenoscyphus varicosporioides]
MVDHEQYGGQTFGIGGGTGVSPSYANYASASAVCLAFINSWPGEGTDCSELSNDAQDAMESGNAIADILYGNVNPSGKLIHTITKNASDYPATVCSDTGCTFSEGVYIDYRWFYKEGIEPRYPFRHGLSYTTFSYDSVTVTNNSALVSKHATGQLGLEGQVDLFDEIVVVNTTVQNTGSLACAEVAQHYGSFPEEVTQSVRILRGSKKVNITAGSTSAVSFSLRRRDVSYWDVSAQKWAIPNGTSTFSVGPSSRDIRGKTTLVI